MTGAALVVGLAVVLLLATGVIGGHKVDISGLTVPTTTTSTAQADGRSVGPASAPVKIDVWSDFQCPACNMFVQTAEPKIVNDFVASGKVRVTYHDFAFLDSKVATKESHDAATAARCAGDQGKFWPYHDWLFANQGAENSGAFSRSKLLDIAAAVGIDQGAFTSCYDGTAARAQVDAETTLAASVQYVGTDGAKTTGIGHTPTVLLNGTEVNWQDYAGLTKLIDAAASGSPLPSLGSESPAPSSAVSPSASASTAP